MYQGPTYEPYGYQVQPQNGHGQSQYTPIPMSAVSTQYHGIQTYNNQSSQPQQAQHNYTPSVPSVASFQAQRYQHYGIQIRPHSLEGNHDAPPLPSSTWSTINPGEQQGYQAQSTASQVEQLPAKTPFDNNKQFKASIVKYASRIWQFIVI